MRSRETKNRPQYFPGTTVEIKPGTAVYDRAYEMPARVRRVYAILVEVERPTGMTWRVLPRRLRPATAHEIGQLTALSRLHRQRLRGLAPDGNRSRRR